MKKTIRKVIDHARDQGWVATLTLIAKNIRFQLRILIEERFDRKYRVDTAGCVRLEDLCVLGDNRKHGVYYEPTPKRIFLKLLSELDIEYQEFEFVDFGCGKGRPLILAARYPFLKITGVEFAVELAEIAWSNLVSFMDERQRCKNLEVLCMDASQYDIPEGKAILYFFNPFSISVMEAIAQNLRTTFTRTRAKKFIIYYHPQSARVFEKLPFLQKVESAKKLINFASPQFRGFVIFETVDEWEEQTFPPPPAISPRRDISG